MSDAATILSYHRLEISAEADGALRAGFSAAGADEGTLWLLDEKQEALVPVWNSGPKAEAFVGRHRQPLSAGLVSLVCVSEQAICENEVYRNAGQDPTLDRRLELLTCAMIAVPLRARGVTCGVVTGVKLKPAQGAAPDPSPFTTADLARVVEAVEEFQRRWSADEGE